MGLFHLKHERKRLSANLSNQCKRNADPALIHETKKRIKLLDEAISRHEPPVATPDLEPDTHG